MNLRALILALSLVPNSYAAHGNATTREWSFTAYLGDNEIGYHRFALTQGGPSALRRGFNHPRARGHQSPRCAACRPDE